MKNIAFAGIAALAALSVQADPVQLASLASVDGKILVNKGRGFVSAKPGMPLADGDRVIALDGSRAAVVYPDGCVTQIKENSLLAMDRAAGCNKEAVKTGGGEQPLRYAQAIGGSATDTKSAPRSTPPAQVPPEAQFASHTPILIGGGLLMGGMLWDTRKDSKPVSPQ